MNDKSNETVPFDRQIGETTVRVEDHARRLQKLEESGDRIQQQVHSIETSSATFEQQLKELQKSTAEISKSVKVIESKVSEFNGFLNGFKAASGLWYALITLVATGVGYLLSKVLNLV